jgi:heme-degrading monooxygenase HmoA
VNGRVRVLIWYRCPPGGTGEIVAAFGAIARELDGTPGLLGSELLEARGDAGSVVVMSEWENMAAFRTWEEGASHKGTTAPLRPYQDRGRDRPFEVYQVTASALRR